MIVIVLEVIYGWLPEGLYLESTGDIMIIFIHFPR